MPSVADELAELRKRSLAKQHGSKLQDAQGLSTPEQEQNALKEAQTKTRGATYTKEAAAKLQQGTKAVSQDLDFQMKNQHLKKQEQTQKKEAAEHLKQGTKAVSQEMDFKMKTSTQKKQEQTQKKEAAENLKHGSKAVSQDLDFQMQQKALKEKDQAHKKQAAENLASFNLTKSESQESDDAVKPKQENTTKEASTPVAKDDAAADELEDIPVLEEISGGAPSANTLTTSTAPTDENQPPPSAGPRVPNRAEKKARKMMERLNMKSVPGIARVTFKMQGNQGIYSIVDASVYEKNGSYIVFGEARQQGSSPAAAAAAQQAAVEQVAMNSAASPSEQSTTTTSAADATIDETGLESKDIELVMSQAGCSRTKAVMALKQNDGDLVNAIMSLTA